MMNAQEIEEFFAEYLERSNQYVEITERMVRENTPEKWAQHAQESAEQVRELYQKNLPGVKNLLAMLDSEMTEEQYDALYQQLKKMYLGQHVDMFLMSACIHAILPYYEAKHDVEALGFCYIGLAFCNIELSRMFVKPYGERALYYYKKVFSLQDEAAALGDPSALRWVAVGYANAVMVLSVIGGVSMEETVQIWHQAQAYLESDLFKAAEDKAPAAKRLLANYIERFSVEGYGIFRERYENEKNKPPLLKDLAVLSERAYEKACREGKLDEQAELMLAHEEYLLDYGSISVDDAFCMVKQYMQERRKTLDMRKDDAISFYVSYLVELGALLPKVSLPEGQKVCLWRQGLRMLEQFIREYDRDASSTYSLNNVLWSIAFIPSLYLYIRTPEDKINQLYRFVIQRQESTYLHSQMVAQYSKAVLEVVLDQAPELLIGFRDIRSAQEAVERREELIRFAFDAALLHDIGKNSMLDLIDTQTRPLLPMEFELICCHPDKGAELLAFDKDLTQFCDVARGHHRFYNGKGGYPENCDNCASPDRIIIDLVTLCDCLDAATDRISRNYRKAKTVRQVLQEFMEGAGTRYNPNLVRLMIENETLVDTLSKMAENGRNCFGVQLCRKKREKWTITPS